MTKRFKLAAPLVASALVTSLTPSVSAAEDPQVSPFAGVKALQQNHESRVKWFREARFGMFIHWGLYSAAGGYWPPDPKTGKLYEQHYSEWIRTWASVKEPDYGKALKPLFKPEPGCTEAWADLAKEAGMRYAVITTKHHEGYTLFNSQADYSVSNSGTGGTNISPAGRDLFKEYVESFRKRGLVPGAYYSLIDWQYPNAANYPAYLKQHLTELASNYGDVGILWVDYSSPGSEGSHWNTRSILETWLQKQPKAVFNNRFWNGLENDNGDFFTPEKYVPPTGYPGRDFEVCHTLNESFGFSYHDSHWKTPREVLVLLSDISSKGGNLLLNIGPDASGHVPEPSVKTLREVGAWLKTHGDAIYGTTASPFRSMPFNGRCTVATRDGQTTLYCHLHEWPADGLLTLTGLETRVLSATLLGDTPMPLELTEGPVAGVKLPASNPRTGDLLPVVAVRLEGEPKIDPLPYPRQAADRSVTLRPSQAMLQFPSTSRQPLRVEGDHIGWWSSPGDSVWFPFFMTQPQGVVHTGGTVEKVAGQYEVELEISVTDGSGGEIEVRLLDQVLRGRISSTGNWDTYRKVKLGKISIGQEGLISLHIRPISIQGQGLMNLREVKLTPVP